MAVITGGSGALGGAMADGLAAAGCKVAVLGTTASKVARKVKDLQDRGGRALGLAGDVLDRAALERCRAEVLDEWGAVDILINCAGGNLPGATILPEETVFDLSLEDFDRVTALNLKGSILPVLVFGKTMAERGRGSIINISSMSAQRPLTRVFGYSASKAAIENATRWLAVEMARKFGPGIRVNAVAPGFFVGAQNRKLLLNEDETLTPRGQTIIDHTPMGRFGEPEDLCGAVQWLASDASRFVTGAVINVDGGFGAFAGV